MSKRNQHQSTQWTAHLEEVAFAHVSTMLPESGSRPFFLLQLPKRAVPESQQRAVEDKRTPSKQQAIWTNSIQFNFMGLFDSIENEQLYNRTKTCHPHTTAAECAGHRRTVREKGYPLAIKSQSVIPGAQHQGVSNVQRSQPASRTAAPKCSQRNTCKLENGTSRK